MTLIDPDDWHPSAEKLAGFSEVALFALGMVAAPWAYLRARTTLALFLWLGAVACRLTGLVRPTALRPFYVGLCLVTRPIGMAVSLTALLIIYLAVITPIALGLRLWGRQAFEKQFDRGRASYWEPIPSREGVHEYLKTF